MRDALKTITAILAALGSYPTSRLRWEDGLGQPLSTTSMIRVGSWQSVRALPSMVRRTSRGDRVDGAYPVFPNGTIGAEL